MSGAYCQRFPACRNFSDKPQIPQCDLADCPGGPKFVEAMMRLEGADLDAFLRANGMEPDDLLRQFNTAFS